MIQNDLGWVDGNLAFSFANLMELRFVAFFSGAGVNIRAIRAIMHDVRSEIHRPHPFATELVFETDGKKIVADSALRNGRHDLLDLRSKNFELGGIVYQSLKEGVVYNPEKDARTWFPRKLLAPNVIVHPTLAFGRPVLKGSAIPVEAIADTMRAERDIEFVAQLFEIRPSDVREALAFDADLRKAA